MHTPRVRFAVPGTPFDPAPTAERRPRGVAPPPTTVSTAPLADAAELETLRREAEGALLRCEMLQRQVEHERAVSSMLRCQQCVA